MMKSIKKLMQEYCLDEKELMKIMHECVGYYLSEDELYNFILEDIMKREMKLNIKFQK